MRIQLASPTDHHRMLELFPRLASFDVPENRNPEHLWSGDAEMLADWAAGKRPDIFVHVAKSDDDSILGVSMVTMRPELLSHAPSAHLEVVVVAEGAEGKGIGGKLLAAAEEEARVRGARSMTLHVFARNVRARRIYERAGFDGELIRYIKPFFDDALN